MQSLGCFRAYIHDHLDLAVRPSVVLINPPFSAAARVEGRVADAALRHMTSALARIAEGGRLVAITGASLSPDDPPWRESFMRLQERGRVVFSAAVDGSVHARHDMTIDTRLTVIDRVPADDPTVFPASPGMAADAAALLAWVGAQVPPRLPIAVSATIATTARPLPMRTRPVGARRSRAPIYVRSICARCASSFCDRFAARGYRLRLSASTPRISMYESARHCRVFTTEYSRHT
jgi:hypothetical protein